MKKIRFGILGAGGIADRRTMPGMLLSEYAHIQAVMELKPEVAEALRVKYGAESAYTTEEGILSDPNVDAVYIASPVFCHTKTAKLAADHGKHILIEKPIALSAAEGEELVEYCHQKGVKIAAGFMMRFGTHAQKMREIIADGRIGDVVSAYSQFTCWYPDIENCWRQNKAQGAGGALMDMGVHCIDLVRFVTGLEVRQVAGMHDTMTFHYEVEDSSTVLLRLSNGAVATINSAFNVPDEAALWRLEIFGTRGRLIGSGIIGQEDGGTLDVMCLDGHKEYDPMQNHEEIRTAAESAEVTFGNMYAREVDSFCRSILEDQPLEVPAEDAVWIQKIVEAAYQSNDEGRLIDVAPQMKD